MNRLNTSLRFGLDWVALSTYLALVLIGWLMVYSSSSDTLDSESVISLGGLINKHFIWLLFSLFIFVCSLFIDWKFWDTFSYVFYALGILSLIGVLFFGMNLKGATSWYSIFGFSFQPGETAKFFTCLAVASYLSSYKTDLSKIRSQISVIGIFMLPSFLIILQPDAGSALVFLTFFILLFREGITPLYHIIGISLILIFIFSLIFGPEITSLLLIGLGAIILSTNFSNKYIWIFGIIIGIILSIIFVPTSEFLFVIIAGISALSLITFLQWNTKKLSNYVLVFFLVFISILFSFGSNLAFEKLLKPHQQDRINVWLRPHLCDPQGSLYHIIQSKLAIGSGGLQGKGFLKGNMTKLDYVPEKSSDFIFSIIGEEQGFLGVISVILLFILLLYRIIVIGERSKSNFVRNYAYGVAGIIFIHYFLNIGMTLGIMPVIGIPLPFLSQGGSALVAFSLMIGVLLKMDLAR